MKMPEYRTLAIWVGLGLVILAGCDQRVDESSSEDKPVSRSLRGQRPSPVSSRASQDDSLYRQILATLQQENRVLKQKIDETVKKQGQLETQLNEIRLERDVAFKAYLKVSESIQLLTTDASSKDFRIQELEQANQTQEQTIVQLNQQIEQLFLELNNSQIANRAVVDPNI